MANETMKDFENDIERSFKVLKEGDIIDVTVIGVSDSEITVDLNYYTEGIIPLDECSNDPAFSIKNDINIGDTIKAMVIDSENSSGNVLLSMKEANDILVWDKLKEDYKDGTVFNVKITESVPSGVVCYVKGVRAFIPASQLALQYVEDTESYVGMKLDAVIITVEPRERKLVLSAKVIEKERALSEKTQQIGRLTIDSVVEGTVERIESYGAFINIGEGLTGLCHISQITNKFIKSPKEELKLGDKVKAKIINIEGDKIGLSIKALKEDEPEIEEESYDIPSEYSADSSSADESPFAKLLQGIKL
ncbi:MAG: S1 RNA-binding domain-containing protein [Lachnospiraceae bacterium]|nr:S1 RNA-binding domain-containing protein [Lachnospiraceae bacterium]MBQ2320859.1 S1 RNA-binding domain-containing protein [Lachnospiraceae bacterium]